MAGLLFDLNNYYIEQLDFQVGPDTLLPQRLHWYNALLGYRHRLPVHSTVILLRRQAGLRTIDGVYTERLAEGQEPYLQFRYRVIRLWRVPVEQVLTAGVSLLPLAGLCAVSPQDLPGVIRRIQQRLDSEAEPQLAAELWTATDVLLGLLFEQAFIDHLLQGVRGMKESVTYQAILEEGRKKGLEQGLEQGRAEGIREVLLELGEEKFGSAAPEAIREQLTNIVAVAELERLSKRLLKVQSWAELLAPESAAVKPSRRKKST